jgi:GT2 family glycosyltransferase
VSLAVLIVNWNVRDLLRACLASLRRDPVTGRAQIVVVVDNASGDGSADMARAEFPEAQVVASPRNLGFTGGNNLALAEASRLLGAGDPSSDYFLLLNPDAEVTPGALDTLARYADARPDIGVLAPQLRYPDGQIQPSRRRFPTLATALFESTWLQPLAPPGLLDRYYARDLPDDQPSDVDWVVGAAMLVRRAAVDQAGGMDDQRFFMYSEELDWCRRIKAAGWRVVYCPQATVIHHEGKSSEQVSAQRMIYFNTSKVRYFAKHHGRRPAAALRLALLAMFAEQLAVEAAKGAAGHRRDLRASRIKAYWAVLRSGLQ